ncbi:MAG: SsrA-binding protein SmpB [Candidatus Omnitrophica bacterium]|nr:SsrA-binding protein SmpB [Candidatus Omnitrophota bacterium]
MKKTVATNPKAQKDYQIIQTIEAGIQLKGAEVKSLREAKVDLKESFARIENNEIILYNMYIGPYEQASYLNVEPKRPRKLLLHKKEIHRLLGRLTQRGFTLVPLRVYFNERNLAKIELALCKGKKIYDRREEVKRKEEEKKIQKIIKVKKSKYL